MFFFGIEGENSFKMRALVFAGLATTSTCIIKQLKGINVGKNIFLKKKKKERVREEKEEEITWETILIQKISCIEVKIKKKKNSLKISIFQHL